MTNRVFVGVNLDVTRSGTVCPRAVIWRESAGKDIQYKIDRLTKVCRMSDRDSGYGFRYTVIIHGKKKYLFEERGKWFVEVEEKAQ